MAHVSSDGEEHQNDIILTAGTITFPPLPTLPFDVLPEILCRLPVRLLVQLRCLCKFFNSLISDSKFAKKHLQFSKKRHHLMVTSWYNLLYDSPIPSLFSTSTIVTMTQLYPPNSITIGHNFVNFMCSCDGIFCGMLNSGSYFLWNPSIRTFKLLPPLEFPGERVLLDVIFCYDHFIDNYKLISVSTKNEVFVYTLGIDYWTRIEDFPYSCCICGRGVFLSGTVNWFAEDSSLNFERVIVSLDLEKESYQNLSKPDLVNTSCNCWTLGVLKDCLCIFASSDVFLEVWVMKEYGNKESWTKFYSVPYIEGRGSFSFNGTLYISENDQMLVEHYDRPSIESKLVVYDSKNGTSNIPEIQSINHAICPEYYIYIESLISP